MKSTFKLFFLLKIPIKKTMAFSRPVMVVLFGLWLCLGWVGAESLLSVEAVAHGGGLDRCGGHHDRKRGTYHRHRVRGGAACSLGSRSEVRSFEAGEGAVEEIVGRASRIVDGDTFWLARLEEEGEGVVRKVRLWGVDSPELRQACVAEGEMWRCGEEARARLRSMVGGDEVRCVVRGRSYDRVVGRCFVGVEDVGEALVVVGLAVEDARYSGGFYGVREAEARTGGMGIWRGCFTEPRRWRARQRDCGE